MMATECDIADGVIGIVAVAQGAPDVTEINRSK